MRIVLVSEEPVFRLGFRALIQETDDLVMVAEVTDARAGLPVVIAEEPDVVAVEVDLPGVSGIDAARSLTRRLPGSRILLLAGYPRQRDLLEGFAAGALGFALKTDPVESLREALREVGAGRRYVSEKMGGPSPDLMLKRLSSKTITSPDLLDLLSAREREVFHLVLKGFRNREIARELCIAVKTVNTHRTHINRKLHCSGAADLVRFAAGNGLLNHVPIRPNGAGEPMMEQTT
jgi:DNA-binding NarL/FixJ family response regulator